MMSKKKILLFPLAAVFFCLPAVFNSYWIDVLNNVGLYAVLALSLNLILGHAGLFHMGHAAFYALGAYTTAILNINYQIPVLLLMPVSGLVAAVFAAVVMRPVIRLRGDYLLIVTMGIGEIVRIALVNDLFGLTGGANGLFGISRPVLFGYMIKKPADFFYLIWFFVAATMFFFARLEHSRFGRALNYIREDEVAAGGSGIDTGFYKLAVFCLGAAWAGMAGTIFAAKMTIISPESFTFLESVMLFCIVILGGSGSIPGMLLGAFLIVGLPEVFKQFASARMLVFGAAIVVMMIFRPQGFLAPLKREYRLPGKEI